VRDFNTPLSPIDRSSKQKINKEILELNDTIDQKDLTAVYRILPPTTAQSAVHRTFSKINHILGLKTSLSKYKKIEITPCILPDHNTIQPELNNKNNSRKYANNRRVNNTLLNDQWVIEEIRKEIKRFLEVDKSENTTYQNLRDRAKAILRGKFVAMSAYIKRTEKTQINDLMHISNS
jgi:hypothetical protein